MAIDSAAFTPLAALAGGALIGAAASLLILGAGRVAGIAGIVGGVLRGLLDGQLGGAHAARWAFLAGLLAAPWLWRAFAPWPVAQSSASTATLIVAGLLVGFGTRLGSGCTSGHGVCGLARLSMRSLANVLAFMAAAMVTVFVLRHVLAG